MVVTGLTELILGIQSIIACTKKNQLNGVLYWFIMAKGKKEYKVYWEVLTLLSQYFSGWVTYVPVCKSIYNFLWVFLGFSFLLLFGKSLLRLSR